MLAKLKVFVVMVIGLGLMFLIFPTTALAADPCPEPKTPATSFFGFPTWYKYLDAKDRTPVDSKGLPFLDDNGCPIFSFEIKLPTKDRIDINGNPFQVTDITAAATAIGLAIVDILLHVAGLVAVAFIFFGGFKYLTSQGDPENAKTARSTILNALIGLVIAVSASVIVAFIGNRFIKP